MDIKVADKIIQLLDLSEWASWIFISLHFSDHTQGAISPSTGFHSLIQSLILLGERGRERGKILLDKGRGLFSLLPSPSQCWKPSTHWQIYDSGSGNGWVPPSVSLPHTLCLYPPLFSESSWDMWDSPCVRPWLSCLLWPFKLLANKHPITHSKWAYPLVRNDQGQTLDLATNKQQMNSIGASAIPQLCWLQSQVTWPKTLR